jgi:hypothetical protein
MRRKVWQAVSLHTEKDNIYRAHFFEGSGDRGPHRKISLWTVHLYAVLLHGAKMRSARE